MPEDMIFQLKSKLHHARITKTDKNYVGSIFICKELLKKAKINAYERVEVFNVTNGKRWSTYVVPSKNKGEISVNGAGARLCQVEDVLIIISYRLTSKITKKPRIVILNKNNQAISVEERKIYSPKRFFNQIK